MFDHALLAVVGQFPKNNSKNFELDLQSSFVSIGFEQTVYITNNTKKDRTGWDKTGQDITVLQDRKAFRRP